MPYMDPTNIQQNSKEVGYLGALTEAPRQRTAEKSGKMLTQCYTAPVWR